MNSNLSQFKLLEGQVIDGKYRLIKLLGAGGFGAVFQADEVVRDRVLRQVAVKLIPPADNPEVQAKQLNELKVAVNLAHPHIIRCFDVGEFAVNTKKISWDKLQQFFSSESTESYKAANSPFLYLVMELADYSLERHLKDEVLSGQSLYQMIAQVADALDYLHTNSLMHQDLKPGNVLWVKTVWKVSDFGTVRDLKAQSFAQTPNFPRGTPGYMPPESSQHIVSPAWDMWSLGIMSAEAAGVLPGTFSESLPLSNLESVEQGCLQWNPQQRWTAKQVLEAMAIIAHLSPPSPQEQRQPQAPTQRIQPTFTDTAPTLPANLRRSSVPQQSAPKLLVISRPSPDPQQSTPKPPVTPCSSPAPTPHQNYQELLPGGVSLEMIAIPAGSFLMGSPDGEGSEDEHPQHRVTVPQVYMGKYPITNAQWRAVMGTDPSSKYGEKFQGDRQPVVGIRWRDAQEFCQRLTQLIRGSYHLPSEAEWEYACRAGSQTSYNFGDENQTWNWEYSWDYAWDRSNSNAQTHPVGEKRPNAFGLYDMHGNVREWCADYWHNNYHGAPTDGSVWLTSGASSESRISRGGSWNNNPIMCRSATRFNFGSHCGDTCGFRVVCSAFRHLR